MPDPGATVGQPGPRPAQRPAGRRPGVALVLTAHGTRSPTGAATVAALCDAVRSTAVTTGEPWAAIREAYVDVQSPGPADVMRELAEAGHRSIIVPLLLSAGYHVRVDLRDAAAATPGTRVADTLGPSAELVAILARRLHEAGWREEDGRAVTLAGAGSSDPRAQKHVEESARMLGERLGREVVASHATAAHPRVTEVVERNAASGAETVVSTYLLAPGHFSRVLERSGAGAVAAPLIAAGGASVDGGMDVGGGPGERGPAVDVPPELVRLVLQRAREAAT